MPFSWYVICGLKLILMETVEILLPLILSVLLFVIYRIVALRLGIIDEPVGRSSHHQPTITASGIVFILVFLLMGLYWDLRFSSGLYVGFLLLGFISFWDDIKHVSNYLRFVFQMIAIGLLMNEVGISVTQEGWLLWGVTFIFGVGVLNAFNFMDGINGMFGLLNIVVIGSLLSAQYGWFGLEAVDFIDPRILWICLSYLVVFSVVNVRKSALAFLGDAGSITIGFVVFYSVSSLVLTTSNYTYLLLFALFGVDTGLTALYKIMRGENIFKPHRDFLFKRLVHRRRMPHVLVSIYYALVQLVVNVCVLLVAPRISVDRQVWFLIMHVGLLIFIYVLLSWGTGPMKHFQTKSRKMA